MKTIIITGILDTRTSFGVIPDTGESVFIPASLARQFDLAIGEDYEAMLAPNAADRRDTTPWRAIKLTGAPVMPEEGLEEDWDDQDVLDILTDHDCSMLAQHVTMELLGSNTRQEVSDVTVALDDLTKRGEAARAVISVGPLTEIRYAVDVEAFR